MSKASDLLEQAQAVDEAGTGTVDIISVFADDAFYLSRRAGELEIAASAILGKGDVAGNSGMLKEVNVITVQMKRMKSDMAKLEALFTNAGFQAVKKTEVKQRQ